jgi:hypothetical protein
MQCLSGKLTSATNAHLLTTAGGGALEKSRYGIKSISALWVNKSILQENNLFYVWGS